MFAANVYPIRFATADDADALGALAERNSQEPLVGRVLIAEVHGSAAAAISLHDGRVIADSSPDRARLVTTIRMRAGAIKAFETTPSLRQRLLAALPTERGGATVTAVPSLSDGPSEDSQERIAA